MTRSPVTDSTTTNSDSRLAPKGNFLLSVLWRSVLLLLTVGLAGGAGLVTAHFYPATTSEVPLLEKVLRQSRTLLQNLRVKTVTPAAPKADAHRLTLPSDALFKDSQSVLRPGTESIFSNILVDLQRYEGATIRIAAHTDDLGENNQELSLRQAQAIQQYLSRALGGQYHWVILGYGNQVPLVENTTDTNRLRNRRIEITIDSFER